MAKLHLPCPCSLYPHSATSTPAPGSLSRYKDHRQQEQRSPCLGSWQSLSVLLLWCGFRQARTPLNWRRDPNPRSPAGPSIPGGVGHSFSLQAELVSSPSQLPGLPSVPGRGCSCKALMFLSAILLSCFFKRCRFPYRLLPERSDKPLQVKLYLRCGPEGALKNMAHIISCIYLNYSGESRGWHWEGAGKQGLCCLIGVHI